MIIIPKPIYLDAIGTQIGIRKTSNFMHIEDL